ncbi:MAG: UDP-2,4-diacetamido-2,4,6-trideoxy-beta-L-altropyranose hydrolase [Terriglobales bacterium]
MKRGILLVRADATVTSGTGHAMRCLALAQAWQHAGGDAIFVMAQATAAIRERLRLEQVKIVDIEADSGRSEDLRQTVAAARSQNAEWLAVDGYHFQAQYVSELQKARPLLLIDDNGELDFYSADWVLNQNVHTSAEMYAKRALDTRLLLGPRYTLLRNEFTAYRSWTRKISARGTRVLLTMGGSDPKDLAPGILSALAELSIDDLQIRVVVGGSAENRSGVADIATKFPGRVEVLSNVANMAELMAWADVAIAGAGITCWEMCLLGLPAILVVVAENQRLIAEHLADVGAAVNAGSAETLECSSLAQIVAELLGSDDRRRKMSDAGRRLVDGLGSERVRAALLGRELNLRLVREDDCRLLFEWAGDPAARAASFHSAPISWEHHVRWFGERLQDPHSVIYIGENAAGEAVGLVRFQIKDDSAVLSVNVAPKLRGRGWGRELIMFATHALVRSRSVHRVEAFVKPQNEASVRLFEASGFRRAGIGRVAGQDVLLFTWECRDENYGS